VRERKTMCRLLTEKVSMWVLSDVREKKKERERERERKREREMGSRECW